MGATTKVDRAGTVVRKTARVTVTKVDAAGDGPGGFDALVAVFGNEDSQGDIVIPGAFTAALAARDVFPVLWAHQFHDDSAILGSATAEQTDDGLVFHATFLDTPRAQNVRALMAAGLVTEFSWSGRVTEGAWVETDDDWWYEIRSVDLWEAGPCFKGANDETELLGVKAATVAALDVARKEGRVLAQKHVDALKSAIGSLTDLLAAVETITEPDEEKADDPPSAAKTPDADADGTQEPTAPAVGFVISTTKARLALA